MTVLAEENFKHNAIERVAYEMCLAARTAPKTRGVDLIVVKIAGGDTVVSIADKMEEIFNKTGRGSFKKNADSVRNCSHIVLIGAKTKIAGLKPCGFCGYGDCDEAEKKGAVCAFNAIDLGIAAGSALSIAADNRVDNRVMWTIGMAALENKIFEEDVKAVLGIPLSATGKNIFFDRK